MTKEETIREKIFNIIKYNIELDDYGNHIYYNTICAEILSVIKQEKTDLLKEFVEWYKGHLEHILEHEKELLKEHFPHLVDYRMGTTNMLDRLLSNIDDKLEEFLEEKGNDRN